MRYPRSVDREVMDLKSEPGVTVAAGALRAGGVTSAAIAVTAFARHGGRRHDDDERRPMLPINEWRETTKSVK